MTDTPLPDAQSQLETQILDDDRVVSIGRGADGLVVRITPDGVDQIGTDFPATIDGHEIEYRVTDPVGIEPTETPSVVTDPVPGLAPDAQTGFAGRRASHAPIPGGVSIGHRDVTAGTSGFLLTNGNATYLAGNNHVLANTNAATYGDPIYQPGQIHDGDVVGRLIGYVPVEDDARVDLAWAEIHPDIGVTPALVGLEPPYGEPITPDPGDEIVKTGLNGIASGLVREVGASVTVNFGNGEQYVIRDQLVVDSVSSPGDSGSPVLFNGRPAGMNFAGNGEVSIINPAEAIEAESGMQIVTRDPPPATALEDVWTYRARPDPHSRWRHGVADGDTYHLVVDQGFGSTHQVKVRAKHIDTAEIWGAEDDAELDRAREQRDFARAWMADALDAEAQWPLRIRTDQATGHYGRWLAEVYNTSGESLEWALYERFGDAIVEDMALYSLHADPVADD